MKRILISPFAKKLRPKNGMENNNPNAKNYPYWNDVVNLLKEKNYYIIQVGTLGEELLPANEHKFNLSLQNLKTLLDTCDTWICVDSFFQHFATYHNKKGVVIFGKSDPNIFGYERNINLLKSRSFLREDQFNFWDDVIYDKNVFVNPDVVIDAVELIINALKESKM